MELLTTYNREGLDAVDIKNFKHRRAARGVVFDDLNNIAILYAPTKGYYAIPGGEVEQGETFEQGVIRECKEEIGCDTVVIKPLGRILEYRKNHTLINESYGYLLTIIGGKGTPYLVGDENADEKEAIVMWMTLDEAIRVFEQVPVMENLYRQYCNERDLEFLKKARMIL